MKKNLILLLLIFFSLFGYGQRDTVLHIDDHKNLTDSLPGYSNLATVYQDSANSPTFNPKKNGVYKLNPAVDIPVIAVGSGWSIYAFTKIYSKGASTEQQILDLKTNDINSFDRGAVRPYSQSLDNVSYPFFYASMPLPFIFFLTGEQTRHDFGKLSALYWETFSVTGLFGTGATYFVDRYRPYTYSNETPMDKRIAENAKNSFYAGHVEVVATSTFFIAKVYSDYYPESKIKWVFYGAATAATGGMAYLRYQAGMHFPSDIIIGSSMGALAGILVPQFHKHRLIKNHDLSIVPFSNEQSKGLALFFK